MEQLKQSHPGRVDYLAVDMAANDASAKIKEALAGAFGGKGKLDGLVLNHGVLDPVSKVEDANVEEWKEGFMINFFSGVALVSELRMNFDEFGISMPMPMPMPMLLTLTLTLTWPGLCWLCWLCYTTPDFVRGPDSPKSLAKPGPENWGI